jgi:hypothetical protein
MKNVMEKPRESRFLVNQVAGFLKNRGFSVRHYIDFRKKSLDTIVELLVTKVRQFNFENGIQYVIVRAEEVFKNAGVCGPNDSVYSDADFRTECPTCKTKQHLGEAPISLDGDDTLYTCKNGCQPIAVVSRPGIVAWPGRGYRLGNHVIRNASDITILVGGMLIPASQAALMKVFPHG